MKYKKAVHLMPDIERKAFDVTVVKAKRPSVVAIEKSDVPEIQVAMDHDYEDLVTHFTGITLDTKMFCEPNFQTNVMYRLGLLDLGEIG